jgi:hypothetical protein
MKTTFLFVLLLAAALVYFFQYTPPKVQKAAVTLPAPRPAPVSQTVIIASAPSVYNRWTPAPDRWKTGPNAQTDLKAGPNAQTDFAPFAPSEQANWNETPGYTVASASMSVSSNQPYSRGRPSGSLTSSAAK